MKLLFRAAISLLLTGLALLLLILLLAVNFRRPQLPEPELEGDELDAYYETLQKVLQHDGGELELTLSPRQVSYFADQFLPEYDLGAVKFKDLHLASADDSIALQTVFRDRLGLYYRLSYSGRLRWQPGELNLHTDSFQVGLLPLGWLLKFIDLPDLLAERTGDQTKIEHLELDGSGLRLRLKSETAPSELWGG